MGRILIRFNEEQTSEPIASQIIIEYKVPIAILSALINSKGGEILAEVPDECLDKVVGAFRKRGVTVTVPKLIEVDSEKCFSCGSCVALCPVEAISFDKDFTVQFDLLCSVPFSWSSGVFNLYMEDIIDLARYREGDNGGEMSSGNINYHF